MLRVSILALLLATASAFTAPRLPTVARRAAMAPLSMSDGTSVRVVATPTSLSLSVGEYRDV